MSSRVAMRCHQDCEQWSSTESSSEEEIPLEPRGYENGILTEYWRFCDDPKKRVKVDCRGCRQVYVDVTAYELKKVADQEETFQVILMVKLFWLDKGLKLKGTLKLKDGKEVEGEVLNISQQGTITMIDPDDRQTKEYGKGDYADKTIEPMTDMSQRFFPPYTFTNVQGEPTEIQKATYDFLWKDETGVFVSWSQKLDATFSESLELQDFPLDRQLCRVRILSQKPIEDVQFLLLDRKWPKFSKVCEGFEVDQTLHGKAAAYVRYNDYEIPYYTQRSMLNLLFHLDRRGDYYFNNILLMVFLVNVMALCTFAIPLDDASGRLGLVSSCFLAVLAYRYIINEILPRKAYLTAADKYITFACMFLIVICLETVVATLWRSGIDKARRYDDLNESTLHRRKFRKQRLDAIQMLDYYDLIAGLLLGLSWVVTNLCFWCMWKMSRRASWNHVYTVNQEPYCPVEECTLCGHRWLARQCNHMSEDGRQACPCCDTKAHVTKQVKYLSPMDFPNGPLVKPQPLLKEKAKKSA